MNKTKAVFDTSPLVFLDRLEYTQAVGELFEMFVPATVVRELSKHPDKAGGQLGKFTNLRRQEPTDDALALAKTLNIDAGETFAIALALDLDCFAVLDDLIARKRGRALGLTVIGTVGILLLLNQHCLSSRSLEDDLNRLVSSGMWLSQKLIQDILTR